MSIARYRAFVEAASCGCLTAAASSLNYTQPGISHMITSLEKEYGFLLFHRSKQGVTLTEEGERLFVLCQQLLQIEEEIHNTVSQYNGVVAGRIRVGSYLSAATAWIPEAARVLSQRYPQLELTLIGCEPDDQPDLLKNNVVDIGVGSCSNTPNCTFIPLAEDPAVAVLPKGHELAKKEKLHPSDLLHYPLIAQTDLGAQELKTIFGPRYASLKSKYVVKHDPAILCLVEKGVGIGVTSALCIPDGMEERFEVRYFNKPYARVMGLAIPKWKPVTQTMQCFIKVMRELYQKEPFLMCGLDKKQS